MVISRCEFKVILNYNSFFNENNGQSSVDYFYKHLDNNEQVQKLIATFKIRMLSEEIVL